MMRDLILRAKASPVYRMLLGRWVNQRHVKDQARLVNSLYKAAFGRLPEAEGLANRIHQLQSGESLEDLAEEFVVSPEFQTRHGTSQSVDTKYLMALYRDGLRLKPDLKYLAHWLAESKKGATRAKVLAAIAGSAEALEMSDPPKLDAIEPYSHWIALNDTISNSDRAAIGAHIAGMPFRPRISVMMPIGRASQSTLRESFHSVIKQLYPDWELCIAIDAITEPLWTTMLPDRATNDPRIRVARLGSVENTAAATNAALDLSKGEFVTFLLIGDLLPEHALYEVAIEIAANPCADVVYSDSDQISAAGQRVNPWFKPGWDPDLLLAQDYISDLAVYRRTLIEEIGFLRPGFEGAEFHDLALRATAATTPDRVRHIPAILYHKGDENKAIHSENAFGSLRAIAASHRAVRERLDSRGEKQAILKPAPQLPSAIRVIWPLPEPSPLVSVIVPTRDRADLLTRCVQGVLRRTDYSNLELLIVDNGSVEPATQTLFYQLAREDNRVRILRYPGSFNYSALNNSAAREANGEILLLLNNDIDVIEPGWLRELVSQALRPDVGIVGAKLLFPDERVQHAGIVLGPEGHVVHLHRFAGKNDPGYCGQLALPRTLLAVTGACVAIRRAVFFEVGGLDEVNLPVAFNDVDLCLRLGDHGYRVVWTPFAELFHLESASRGLDSDDPAKRERADREWCHMCKTRGSLLETGDPFQNPNLLFHWDYQEIPSTPRRRKPWHYIAEEISNLNRYFPPIGDGSTQKPGPLDGLLKKAKRI
jgi:O-antigen biosynthesis protein